MTVPGMLVATALCLDADVAPRVETPPDPFAHEYAPPRRTEVGTAPGQLRVLGAVGGTVGKEASAAAQGTLELMTLPWVGVRASALATLPRGDGPQIVSARLGPSLHLLPFRRVDLGLFTEGGVALLDVGTEGRTLMPALAAGATLDVALGTYVLVHFEGLLHGGIADRGGAAERHLHAVGLAGIGLLL